MMQQDPGLRSGIVGDDQATTPGLMDDTAKMPDKRDEAAVYVSHAPAANMPDGQIKDGVPVFDVHGETIGNVATYDEAAGKLVVRGGWLFKQDTTFPLSAIGDRGASGIYLTQGKDELQQQYGDGSAAGKRSMSRDKAGMMDQTARGDTSMAPRGTASNNATTRAGMGSDTSDPSGQTVGSSASGMMDQGMGDAAGTMGGTVPGDIAVGQPMMDADAGTENQTVPDDTNASMEGLRGGDSDSAGQSVQGSIGARERSNRDVGGR